MHFILVLWASQANDVVYPVAMPRLGGLLAVQPDRLELHLSPVHGPAESPRVELLDRGPGRVVLLDALSASVRPGDEQLHSFLPST
jgi:hypothetical protein